MNENEVVNCGLIMPLAPMVGYKETHFSEVQSILIKTINDIKEINFNPRMVSESEGEIDIIHNNIVNNIYDDPIVIVDISGRNGNVMLELGLRLAFDKPLIIVKDDMTDYMFDISMIEHISYPSDLRHTEILKFQQTLKDKVIRTYNKAQKDENYSPFLKNFKRIKVSSIENVDVNQSEILELILDKIDKIEHKQLLIPEKNSAIIQKDRDTAWRIGDKVEHKKWGIGTVLKISGSNKNLELDIDFPEQGTKRLLINFAPVTKIEK